MPPDKEPNHGKKARPRGPRAGEEANHDNRGGLCLGATGGSKGGPEDIKISGVSG